MHNSVPVVYNNSPNSVAVVYNNSHNSVAIVYNNSHNSDAIYLFIYLWSTTIVRILAL